MDDCDTTMKETNYEVNNVTIDHPVRRDLSKTTTVEKLLKYGVKFSALMLNDNTNFDGKEFYWDKVVPIMESMQIPFSRDGALPYTISLLGQKSDTCVQKLQG